MRSFRLDTNNLLGGVMLAVGEMAPAFGGLAVVQGEIKSLTWRDIHGGRALALFFEPDTETGCADHLLSLNDRSAEWKRLDASALVVCPDTPDEILRGLEMRLKPAAFLLPILADAEERVSSTYEAVSSAGEALWGRILVDREGRVREVALSDAPFPTDVDALIRQWETL